MAPQGRQNLPKKRSFDRFVQSDRIEDAAAESGQQNQIVCGSKVSTLHTSVALHMCSATVRIITILKISYSLIPYNFPEIL